MKILVGKASLKASFSDLAIFDPDIRSMQKVSFIFAIVVRAIKSNKYRHCNMWKSNNL